MAVNTVMPGVDTFADLFTKFNANAEAIPVSAQFDAGAQLSFFNYLSALLATAQFPAFQDRIQSGLVVSITGAGPYAAAYTAGSFVIDSVPYEILAGSSVGIGAADATNDRIDVLVADTSLNVTIVAGTAAATPAVPAIASTQLAIGYVYVFAVATGKAPTITPALQVVNGTTRGRVAAWNGYQFVPVSGFRAQLNRGNNDAYVEVDPNVPRVRLFVQQSGGSPTAIVDLSQSALLINCGFQRKSGVVSGAYNQQPTDNLLLVDTTGGAATITLQNSPSPDYEVTIVDYLKNASANNLTIARNSNLIDNAAADYVISTDGGAVTLHWHAATTNWVITSIR